MFQLRKMYSVLFFTLVKAIYNFLIFLPLPTLPCPFLNSRFNWIFYVKKKRWNFYSLAQVGRKKELNNVI